MVASLYRRRDPADPPISDMPGRDAGTRWKPRYPMAEQVAEIVGRPKQKGLFLAAYARWGTDEGGLPMSGDYFAHRHSEGGYEGFTFFLTGMLVIGFRHDIKKGASLLFEPRRGPTEECPLPGFIPFRESK